LNGGPRGAAPAARHRHITVLKPEILDAIFIEEFKRREIAFSIVVAYGKIFPQALLDVAPMYNIHYSLLPRWRGATPVESAILAGDTETGVAIQRMVYELDAGPIVALEKTPIEPDETAPALRLRLNGIGKRLLVDIFPSLADGTAQAEEQKASQATHANRMTKVDGLLNLNDDGTLNYRKFRAFFGWPGTYTFFERNGRKIRCIITLAHLDGSKFLIDRIKPEGKGEMPYAVFVQSGAKPL
jgi:methionyl-tRNA formyltransferase